MSLAQTLGTFQNRAALKSWYRREKPGSPESPSKTAALIGCFTQGIRVHYKGQGRPGGPWAPHRLGPNPSHGKVGGS